MLGCPVPNWTPVSLSFLCRVRRSRGIWWKLRGPLLECGRSLVPFVCGLLLASLYGMLALLVQKLPLWPCVYVTQVVAVLAAFGLGLSSGVRADVMVLLPSLCSGEAAHHSSK